MSEWKDLYEKGAQQFEEVYSGMLKAADPGADRFMDLMIPNLFGSLWDGDKLPIRDRRLFVMGIIAAMGEYDVYQIQAMAALKRGELTEAELRELTCQAAPYAGYPRSGGLLGAVEKAIKSCAEEK